jgi:hypothetical protein
MTLFRKSSAADAAPGERHCRGCGSALADDQLACLECGAVDASAGARERRWMLPTGGLIAVGLFLVSSASFAATTALNTGDPKAIKEQPPALAQATPPPAAPLPPVSGDGSAPQPSQKGPDLGSAPSAAAPTPNPPAPSGGSNGGSNSGSGGSGSGSGSSGSGSGSGSGSSNGGSNGNSNSGGNKPSQPKPAAVKVNQWQPGTEGYTVIPAGYQFDTKAEAKAKAREILGKGLPAGILNSDDFASLDPGSWLVYIGQFDSPKQAETAQAKYENAGYPGDVTFVGEKSSPQYQDPQSGTASSTPPQP